MGIYTMKRAIYTIADEEFATLLERTHSAFERAKVPYMFVGGVATQAHIVNYLCRNGKTLADYIEDPNFRIQDHLRATDDIDITLDSGKKAEERTEEDKIGFGNRIFTVLDDIAGKSEKGNTSPDFTCMSPSEEHIVGISLERKGLSRPIFWLGLDQCPSSQDSVSFNFYKGPEDTNEKWPLEIREFERNFYHTFMQRAYTVEIPYCKNRKLAFKVKKVEDLMATKIVRGREKDYMDILSLAKHSENAGMPINYDAIKEILCKDDPKYLIPNPVFVEKYEKAMYLIKAWKESQNSQPNKQ
jgi:hypothetical protein